MVAVFRKEGAKSPSRGRLEVVQVLPHQHRLAHVIKLALVFDFANSARRVNGNVLQPLSPELLGTAFRVAWSHNWRLSCRVRFGQ